MLLLALCSLFRPSVLQAQTSAQPKIIIESVKITGAPHLPNDVRARLTSLMHGREFEGSPEKWVGDLGAAVLEAATARMDEPPATYDGYTITAACSNWHFWHLVSRDASGNMHVSIDVELTESPPQRLATIRFVSASDSTAATLFSPNQLRNLVPLREGEFFSVEKIEDGFDAIVRLYHSNGYLDFALNSSEQYDNKSQTVSLVMELKEGQQYRVGDIRVVGLDPALEAALRLKLKPGDVMNFQVVRDFYTENKSVLLPTASPQDVKLTRDVQNSKANLSFDFRALSH